MGMPLLYGVCTYKKNISLSFFIRISSSTTSEKKELNTYYPYATLLTNGGERMTQKISVSFRDWVWSEILEKAQNKSALIEEALIKYHISQLQAKLNKGAENDSRSNPPFFSRSYLCIENIVALPL